MGTYTAQSGDVFAAGTTPNGAVTELRTRVGGIIAGCGEAALAVLLGAAQGRVYTSQDVTEIVQDAIKNHGAGKGGTSTASELAATSQDYGASLQTIDWHTALSTFSGKTPVLLGVSNASAFGGADSNVKGHFVTIVGKTKQGNYIVSDPNTPESVKGKYVTYTPQQIVQAKPFSAQVVSGKQGVQGMPEQLGGIDALVAGVQNIGTSLQNLGNVFQAWGKIGDTIAEWMKQPGRVAKLSGGIVLLLIAGTIIWTKAQIVTLETVGGAATGLGSIQRNIKTIQGVAKGNPPPAPIKIFQTPQGGGKRQVVAVIPQNPSPEPVVPEPAVPATPVGTPAYSTSMPFKPAPLTYQWRQVGKNGGRVLVAQPGGKIPKGARPLGGR